ncbi:MAG: penicillin-binding protein 2 [Verrucomicrobiaceae bacterium]|nr:penicillin-binding protein 2 [Verrucomicrobiaceae bacterium]
MTTLPNQQLLRRDRPICRRIQVVTCLLLSAFCLVSWRLSVLHIRDSAKYAEAAAKKFQRVVTLPAQRGSIRDRRGEHLALDEQVFILHTDRVHLRELVTVRRNLAKVLKKPVAELVSSISPADTLKMYHQHIAEKLAAELGMSQSDFLAALLSPLPENIIVQEMPADEGVRVKQILDNEHIIGVYLRPDVKRRYPARNRLTLLLGDVNSEHTGTWGVERLSDDLLQGTMGHQTIERDRAGRELPLYRGETVLPRDGSDMYLTIDMNLQDTVEEILEAAVKHYRPVRAMIVVVEPSTGSILAMAARPHFDRDTKTGMQRNLVISDAIEPGSIFKIVPLTAALDLGVVTPRDRFDCEHMYYTDPVLKVKLSDDEPLGMQTVTGVLVHSSNIGTYKIFQKVGQESFLRYVDAFGFGQKTGLGLTGEHAGRVNHSNWSNPTHSRFPIGYEVGASALQLTMAYAAIANGGVLMRPRLIDRVVDCDGVVRVPAPVPVRQVCSPATAEQMKEMLGEVIVSGTGKQAAIAGVTAGGKTGTARRYDETKDNGPGKAKGGYMDGQYVTSFAGFAPLEAPKVACLVVLDYPQLDSGEPVRAARTAAPIFAEVVREALDHLAVRPPPNLAAQGGAAR